MAELPRVDYVKHEPDFFKNTVHSKMRRVALSQSGEVVGIHDPFDTNKWEDGTEVDWVDYRNNGWNCMVQIPKFYYKVTTGEYGLFQDVYRCEVSETERAGFKIHPAFNRVNGVIENYQYIGAFEGSYVDSKLRSLPRFGVKTNCTRFAFRTWAELNGPNFTIQDYYLTSAIQMLFVTEYASFNSQNTLGLGYALSTNVAINLKASTFLVPGTTLDKGNQSYGTRADWVSPISYRGIENLWGNTYAFLDGINYRAGYVFLAKKDFSDSIESSYISARIVIPNLASYTSKFHKPVGFYDFTFFPSEMSSYAGPGDYTQGAYGNATNIYSPVYGYGTDNQRGLFSMNYSASLQGAATLNTGARLQYIVS